MDGAGSPRGDMSKTDTLEDAESEAGGAAGFGLGVRGIDMAYPREVWVVESIASGCSVLFGDSVGAPGDEASRFGRIGTGPVLVIPALGYTPVEETVVFSEVMIVKRCEACPSFGALFVGGLGLPSFMAIVAVVGLILMASDRALPVAVDGLEEPGTG